jgi:hypothetical protein
MGKLHVLDAGKEFSPRQSILQALEKVDELEQLVWIAVDKKGCAYCGWSDGPDLHVLGLLEIARDNVLRRMRNNDSFMD